MTRFRFGVFGFFTLAGVLLDGAFRCSEYQQKQFALG